MIEGTFCAPVPLKLTVLGIAVVTLSVPAVMVNVFAIPSIELVDNNNEVAFRVTLYRLAVPFKVAAPVKVVTPADAEKVPLISNALDTDKFVAVVTVPGTNKP